MQQGGRASMQQGGRASMQQEARASMQKEARGSLASPGGQKVMAATIYTKDEELSTTSEEQPPRMTCWLMPESVQRVIDSGMEKIYGPRPRRPYRPPMLDMEVEEDDYDPYFKGTEATQAVYKPEEGRVMYPSEKRRKPRRPVYPAEEDFDVMFQDELVIGGGSRMMYDDEGDAGYADEGDMYEEETEDAFYMDDMMYQGGQGNPMMYRQPMGQPMMQPMIQPMMGQPMMQPMMGPPVMQQMGQPMMQPMGQSMMPQMGPTMMPQMGQPMMQPPMMQAMPAQQYGYAQQPQNIVINQKDHIEVSSSDTDVNVKWTKQYAMGLPSDVDELNRTGSSVRIDQRVKIRAQKSSTTDSEDTSGKKSAAVQTARNDPISTTSQTERPMKDSKSIEAKVDTDDVATQRNRYPERAADTQTFGTSPFVPGAGMPFMFPPGMMNPFMMGAMGMPQPQPPPPPPPAPEPPPPPPCEECAQLKSCCEDVPFEDLKKNIEEDIANIVNENLEVKISDEDTKILVARPDSPYKLVYLIPQRPQVVKEEKSIQTAKQPTDKSIQTEGKKGAKGAKSFDTDGGEGERVIMASYNTQERQINGKRVRTTKAFRVTQSDDENITEVQESSSSSENGRSRSKRRSRSKKRAKRARSDGAYPRSLTISVGRTSSTTSRSRSPGLGRRSRSPSAGAARSETPMQGQRHSRHWKEAASSSSCSVSSHTNVSVICPASNPEAVSCTARAYVDTSPARTHSRVPSRKHAAQGDDSTHVSTRCTVVTSDTNLTARTMQGVPELPADVKPKSNRVWVERIYNERPESSRFSPRAENRASSPIDMTRRPSGERPPSPRGGRDKGGMVCKPPRSASSMFQTAGEARCYQSPNRNASYMEAERIAKQIAQQIAPQIIAARQKEPMQEKQRSGQSSVVQNMISNARQHHQQLQQQQQQQQQQQHQQYQQQILQPRRSQHRQSPFRRDEETSRYENRNMYTTNGRYTVRSQQSLERLSNAQGSRLLTESKVSRYGTAAAGVTSSLSQSLPQRYSGGGYRQGGGGGSGPPRRSATMSAVSRNLQMSPQQQQPQHLQSRGSPLCGRQSPPARYILPIQLQVTGQPSRVAAAGAGGYNQSPRGGSRVSPGLSGSRSKITMMQQQQRQEQRSSVVMRNIEQDSSSPPRMTPNNSCHGDKKRAFYKRAYRLRIPAQEKQVLTYALVALVALISIILVINTLGKKRVGVE